MLLESVEVVAGIELVGGLLRGSLIIIVRLLKLVCLRSSVLLLSQLVQRSQILLDLLLTRLLLLLTEKLLLLLLHLLLLQALILCILQLLLLLLEHLLAELLLGLCCIIADTLTSRQATRHRHHAARCNVLERLLQTIITLVQVFVLSWLLLLLLHSQLLLHTRHRWDADSARYSLRLLCWLGWLF